jgi:hypothetical protein
MKTRPSSSSAEIDEADPGRYVEVPRADSHEAYRDMEDFIAAIGDERLQELLDVAIQGRGRSAASRMCWNGIPRSDSALVRFSGSAARGPRSGMVGRRTVRAGATEDTRMTATVKGKAVTRPLQSWHR